MKTSKKTNGNHSLEEAVHRLKQSISRELRSSILYRGCDCEKTNGLQDDCQRTDCRGSPECLTKPPTCGPSKFCNGKHLMKKLDLSARKNGKTKNADQGNDQENRSDNIMKYMCFPAVIKSPVRCCECKR